MHRLTVAFSRALIAVLTCVLASMPAGRAQGQVAFSEGDVVQVVGEAELFGKTIDGGEDGAYAVLIGDQFRIAGEIVTDPASGCTVRIGFSKAGAYTPEILGTRAPNAQRIGSLSATSAREWRGAHVPRDARLAMVDDYVISGFAATQKRHSREGEHGLLPQRFARAKEAFASGNVQLSYMPEEYGAMTDYIIPMYAVLSRRVDAEKYNRCLIAYGDPNAAERGYSEFVKAIYGRLGLTHALVAPTDGAAAIRVRVSRAEIVYSDMETVASLRRRAASSQPHLQAYETLIDRVALMQLFDPDVPPVTPSAIHSAAATPSSAAPHRAVAAQEHREAAESVVKSGQSALSGMASSLNTKLGKGGGAPADPVRERCLRIVMAAQLLDGALSIQRLAAGAGVSTDTESVRRMKEQLASLAEGHVRAVGTRSDAATAGRQLAGLLSSPRMQKETKLILDAIAKAGARVGLSWQTRRELQKPLRELL